MDNRFERILNQTKGFRLNFSEKESLDDNDGEEGEFRVNKFNGTSTLYIKLNKKWSSVQLYSEESVLNDTIGISSPQYDSGWVAVVADSLYTLTHNLSSQILKLEVYFRDSDGNIYNITSESLHELYNTPTNVDTGITIKMNPNNIVLGTAVYQIFTAFVSSNTYVHKTSGEIRLLAWKIQGL